MRHAFVAVGLVLLLALTGCFQLEQVVVVKPDGSGTLEVTSCMSEEMVKMMSGFSKMGEEEGKKQGEEEPDMFKEDEIKGKTAELGEGVEYVSMEKVKKDGFVGVKAIYKFADIAKLKLESKPSNEGGGGGAPAENPMTFKFAHLAGGNALLTAVMPKNEAKSKTEPAGEAPKAEKEPTPEELAQMKKMFKGFRFGTSVRVEGALVKTSSAFVDGPLVTLYEVDFGALLENTDKLKELKMKDPQSLAEMNEIMKGIPGFKINVAPEVTIEFAGK